MLWLFSDRMTIVSALYNLSTLAILRRAWIYAYDYDSCFSCACPWKRILLCEIY